MPAENAGRAFALVLVDELVRHGVRHAVIAPGSRSTPISLALLENSRVTVHVRVDERSAAYLALGLAKASGEVVPVLCTSGTATSYFHGAVMEADQSRVPLLVLTADRPPELHGVGANQTVEQHGMYGVAVRWSPSVGVPEARMDSVPAWRALVGEAARRCLGRTCEPAGPVHLNVPLREPLTPTDDGTGFPYELGLGDPADEQPARDEKWTGHAPPELLSLLSGVSRGVIVAGGGSNTIGVRMLARKAGWPIIAEPHSNLRQGRQALRSTDALLRDKNFTAEHRPDLVVVVGRVGLSRALLDWLATVPHIVLSLDGGNWDVTRTAKAVLHLVPGAIGAVAEAVTAAEPSWTTAWQEATQWASTQVDAILDAAPMLTEPQVARDIADQVPDDSNLVVSSSMPIRDLDLVMRPRPRIRLLANRGVSGIDGFVSTAVGIALADRAVPTFALCGDLSLLHDVNGLMPGPDLRPDLTFVVVNNDGGGIFSLLPQASVVEPATFERLFGTPHRMSIGKLAAAYDVGHRLVSTTEELAAALSSYGGVRIIEVRTNRADNAELHARLRAITL